MSSVKIIPKKLKGTIAIPPSKSIAHRVIIAAGLAEGESIIENIEYSKDILATIDGMKSFGVKIEDISNEVEIEDINSSGKRTLRINGIKNIKIQKEIIDCIESGSTLRFLIPIALLQGEKKITFIGEGKLPERPLDEYYSIFNKQNIFYKNVQGKLPLKVKGSLRPGVFYVKGNISSQFITGLMFALPLLKEDSKIIITSKLESKSYVDLTIDVLKKFGVEIENNRYKEFYIKGNQKYKRREYKVEGDFSQAAFWLIGGLIGEGIKCKNLDINSLQGDKEILNIIRKIGGNLNINEGSIEVISKLIRKRKKEANNETSNGECLKDEELIKDVELIIDASQIPDLVPILAVASTLRYGVTKIINAHRVRIKECDRLHAIACELNKIGGNIQELQDGLVINGGSKLKGGEVESWDDHRIAMALGIASILCQEPLVIKNSEVVRKSYPGFWEDFKKLGGDVLEWSMGE